MSREPAFLVTLLLAFVFGCSTSNPQRDAGGTLARYFDAVQAGQPEAIAALLEDCRAERLVETESRASSCATQIAAELASVVAQRELDVYRFEEAWGFALVKALVLGAGAYWSLETLSSVEGPSGSRAWEAELLVRTHYRSDETAGLPPGAVVEYLVAPLGQVRRLRRGATGPGALRDQLVELRLRARLTERDDGWRVASLEALPDTAVFESVSWRPM